MSKQEEQTSSGSVEKIDLTVAINEFFRIFRKKFIWVVLIVSICAAGFSFYKNYKFIPSYTASSTFIISTSREAVGSYYDTAAARQLAETFPYILTSDILQKRVAENLDMNELPGVIRAEVTEATNFLTISVSDSDPQRAYNTLQAVLETLPSISRYIIGRIYMELMDETGIPTVPNNSENFRMNLITGGMIGLLVCILLIVLGMLTNRTIRCEEDCLRRINTRCLGEIPLVRKKARSKKVETYPSILQKHADPDFVEAFRIIRNKVNHSCSGDHMKTILVTSTFAGEGKSTTAVNLALALAQEGKNVALLDCDLRNPSDIEIINVPKGKGLVDFLSNQAKIEECAVRGGEALPHNLPLLFIRGGEPVPDAAPYLSGQKMKVLIDVLEKQMDYVILDTPPAGLLTDAAILAQYAQAAIYVVKKNYARADKIMEGMEYLTEANTEMIGCVINNGN